LGWKNQWGKIGMENCNLIILGGLTRGNPRLASVVLGHSSQDSHHGGGLSM